MCALKSPETVALENGKQVERTKSDFWNICLLLALFALQAIPGGFISAMPLLLQSRGVKYKEQAIFHIVHFPYNVKLLWAPLIDAVYSKKVGKRKTWIVSSQYLLGIFFIILSLNISKWLGSTPEHINIGMLTLFMLLINTFRATQDIALDGWSLTILKKENMAYSGHIAMIGNRIGLYMSYVLFTVLNSPDFCNNWLRSTPQDYPIITTSDFLLFWAVVIIIVTTLLLILKKENDPVHYAEDYENGGPPKITIAQSYRMLIDMFTIKPLRILCAALLVCRAGMGPLHGLTPLKLIDAGVTRAQLVLVAVPLVPILAILPFIMKRYLVSNKSMIGFNFVLSSWGLVSLCSGSFMYFTAKIKNNNGGEFPVYYFAILFLVDAIEKTAVYVSALTLQALFYRVSDRNFGGTYITLLNMLMNLGKEWTVNLSLWLVEPLTWKKCIPAPSSCEDDAVVLESVCTTFIDGYYIVLALGVLGTFAWLMFGGRQIMSRLQKIDPSEWRITAKEERMKEKEERMKEKEKFSIDEQNNGIKNKS